MIKLIQTCGACPEQYDAYLNGEQIGYLRLRHGHFRAEFPFGGDIVYSALTDGDGSFTDEERTFHLNAACRALLNAHNAIKREEELPIYEVEYEKLD